MLRAVERCPVQEGSPDHQERWSPHAGSVNMLLVKTVLYLGQFLAWMGSKLNSRSEPELRLSIQETGIQTSPEQLSIEESDTQSKCGSRNLDDSLNISGISNSMPGKADLTKTEAEAPCYEYCSNSGKTIPNPQESSVICHRENNVRSEALCKEVAAAQGAPERIPPGQAHFHSTEERKGIESSNLESPDESTHTCQEKKRKRRRRKTKSLKTKENNVLVKVPSVRKTLPNAVPRPGLTRSAILLLLILFFSDTISGHNNCETVLNKNFEMEKPITLRASISQICHLIQLASCPEKTVCGRFIQMCNINSSSIKMSYSEKACGEYFVEHGKSGHERIFLGKEDCKAINTIIDDGPTGQHDPEVNSTNSTTTSDVGNYTATLCGIIVLIVFTSGLAVIAVVKAVVHFNHRGLSAMGNPQTMCTTHQATSWCHFTAMELHPTSED